MGREWAWMTVGFVVGGLAGALAVAGLGPDATPAKALVVAAQQGEPVAPTADEAGALDLAVLPAEETAPRATPAHQRDSDALLARLEEIGTGWSRMQDDLARLRHRVADLEQRLTAAQTKPAAGTRQRPRSATPDGQRSALVQAGLADEAAAELVRRQGQQSLDRLNLRDIAVREGWLGTDRYREELALIQEEAVDLRQELGDEAYDRYLYAAGEDNRVQIDAIIPGSVAELAGLQPGDLIETYAGDQVFNYSDLRDASAGGERGEMVQVKVLRAGQRFDAWLSRGPLGVQLDSAAAEPR